MDEGWEGVVAEHHYWVGFEVGEDEGGDAVGVGV